MEYVEFRLNYWRYPKGFPVPSRISCEYTSWPRGEKATLTAPPHSRKWVKCGQTRRGEWSKTLLGNFWSTHIVAVKKNWSTNKKKSNGSKIEIWSKNSNEIFDPPSTQSAERQPHMKTTSQEHNLTGRQSDWKNVTGRWPPQKKIILRRLQSRQSGWKKMQLSPACFGILSETHNKLDRERYHNQLIVLDQKVNIMSKPG